MLEPDLEPYQWGMIGQTFEEQNEMQLGFVWRLSAAQQSQAGRAVTALEAGPATSCTFTRGVEGNHAASALVRSPWPAGKVGGLLGESHGSS